MKLTSEEIRFIEKLGFNFYYDNIYEKQYDGWRKDYIVIHENGFRLESHETLIEEDGSQYEDFTKTYPEEGDTLIEFLTKEYL